MRSIIFRLLIMVLAFSSTACAQGGGKSKHTIKIQKDKYYQLVRMSINPEKKAQLDDYFKKMGPAIMESGVKILAEFMVTEALDGDGPAQMIMIAEFPDEEAPKKIYESELFLNHRNQRDHVLTYLSEGFFRATEDGEFNIGGDGVLEIASLWPKANGKANLDSYFQAVMPEAVKLGLSIAPFRFVSASKAGSYHAPMVVLGNWKTAEGRNQFFNGQTFKQNVAKRTAGLCFLEMYSIKPLPKKGNQAAHQ